VGKAAQQWSVASALVAVAVIAGGCATAVSGSGHLASGAGTPSEQGFPSDSAFPSDSTTPTAPASTSLAPPTTATSSPPITADFTDLHYRVPKGFVKAKGYYVVRPLESHYAAAWVVPSNERNGLDVLSILLYRLPRARPIGTLAQQKARITAYNHKARAHRQRGFTLGLVGGRIAVQESLIEDPNYRYVSWFVFGTRHVLQVNCQVDRQVDKVAKACGSWVASIRLN
jgi:hypothetical protein